MEDVVKLWRDFFQETRKNKGWQRWGQGLKDGVNSASWSNENFQFLQFSSASFDFLKSRETRQLFIFSDSIPGKPNRLAKTNYFDPNRNKFPRKKLKTPLLSTRHYKLRIKHTGNIKQLILYENLYASLTFQPPISPIHE